MAAGAGKSRPAVSNAQRRARLAVRHALGSGSGARDAAAVARALVAVHATDPPTVYLSIAARTDDRGPADVAGALHSGTTTRMTGMRRTVFVFDTPLAGTVLDSTARPLAVRDRATVLRMVQSQLGWDTDRLSRIEDDVVAAVTARGSATGRELGDDVPVLRTKIRPSSSANSSAPEQPVSMRILYYLAMVGRIARGRPIGGWTSGQYTWTVPAQVPPIEPRQARADLLGHYLRRYGPVTEADIRWWTGWTLTDTRHAVRDAEAVPVDLSGGQAGYLAADDLSSVEPAEPWVALLPALDSTVMGWRERDWYLPDQYASVLTDRSGNVGPTIWADGRVVGGWAQRADGHVCHRMLADVDPSTAAAIATEEERLQQWLGATRVSPRFHTPLEAELCQGRRG